MNDERLQLLLERAGDSFAFARHDELVDDVLAAIDGQRAPVAAASPGRTWWRAVAAVAAIVALLVAVPAPRRTIARWLGFDSVRIERAPVTIPRPEPSASQPAQDSTPTTLLDLDAALLDLGPAVTADEAQAFTGLDVPLAPSLGIPRSIHAVEAREVVVVYDVDGTTVLVAAIPGRLDEGFFGKTLATDSTLTEIDVDGRDGYWIAGSPHSLFYVDDDGEVVTQTLRLATNTLLFEDDGVVSRVEGAITLDAALAIAAQL